MFDVGFSEMLMIGIVALVVIGPERLPKVARTVGLLLGRMRRYVSDVKADLNREMQLEELKQLRDEMQDSAREFERSMANGIQSIEQSVQAAVSDGSPTPMAHAASTEQSVALPTGADKPVTPIDKG